VLSLLLLGDPTRADDAEQDGLSRLLAGLAESAGFEGHFVEEVEVALLREPVRSHGALYFVPPDRLARFTTRPIRTALLIDGERVEFRDAEDHHIDLSASPLARHFTGNLLLLFAGDRDALEASYRAVLEEDGPRWKLRLTPRHAPLSKAIAHIVLEGLRDELERMEVLDGEGARTVTHLDQVQTNRRFAAAELATLFEEGRPLPLPDHGR
jgi:outer membrane lipoprotein-sorting protein